MRIYSSPFVMMKKASFRGWHRHAGQGTFLHLRSSPKDAHFFHTTVLLMPSRPIRFCTVNAAKMLRSNGRAMGTAAQHPSFN
jgi:hypothetical protein